MDMSMQKNKKRPIPINMYKSQVQMVQRPQHKANHTEPTEEKVGRTFEHIGTGDHVLNITPAAQTLRESINKWDILKLKSFCIAKDMVNETK